MTRCHTCPHLYVDQPDPRGTVREECCIDVERRNARAEWSTALSAEKNMMINDIAAPERAPLNRAERRRREARERKQCK